MAASAADVRSILSIPSQSGTPQATQKKPQAQSARKPEGISRELFSLIGSSAPTLAAQLLKPRLKQKPNLGNRSCVKWEWRSFKNDARSDGLQLGHWTKASTDPTTPYPFSKYNIQPTVYKYTDEEYTQYLQDQAWTKEETDYLFRTIHEYDTRWYVVFDRYEYPGGVSRSLEDMKDRYFSVCRKLVRNRPWTGDEASKSQLIQSFQFDKEREVTRKKYVTSLENRTPEQIAEEEALFIELKRLEQNERRFKRDRDELLRTLAGIDSGLPDVVEDEASLTAPLPGDFLKRKKTKSGIGAESEPAGPSNTIALGPPIIRKPQNAKSAAYDAQHCITRTEQTGSGSTTKAAHQPAFLRSFKIPFPKAALAPRINQGLTELGINPTRLVMPTRDNCSRLEALIEATTAMVETKKTMDKVEYEIRVAKGRLGIRESEEAGAGGGAAGESISTGIPVDAMDVDEAEGGGDDADEELAEDGRAQSVASVRSARGRRQSRRSMSISSVDTSATLPTRAGTKRQKRG
ncbi:hypothetical protein HGRIS_009424 [Hohenbuehelia grisea]|uniref:SWR1-complex protein 4 n=1 Tax=Hohenbuehelia grisea TaxID=104357 RepID=A0ABR3J137_9AGAR